MTNLTPEALEAIRQVVREEIAEALEGARIIETVGPFEEIGVDPARIEYTEEIAQWYAAHPFSDDKGRPVDAGDWADTVVGALLLNDGSVPFPSWLPSDRLNWQGRAFVELENALALSHHDTLATNWLSFHYYLSLASTHPDYDKPGTPAHTVRLAVEQAIAEQREKQGGDPA